MQGDSAQAISWPMSLVGRCLPEYSVAKDMIFLSSELAFRDNIELCGSDEIDSSLYNDSTIRVMANVLKIVA